MPAYVHLFNNYFKIIINEIKVVQDLTIRLNAVEVENTNLRTEIDKLKTRVDDQEQRSRNECLLVHGMDESDEEDTDEVVLNIIKDNLNIEIDSTDIVRSHRLGPKKRSQINTRATPSRPRPIIIRFLSFKKRQVVYKAKSLLKGKNIIITENLTQHRYQLYLAAKRKYGLKNCWSNEGRVFAKSNNRIITISNMSDIV